MRKRRILLPALFLTVALGLAQEANSLETRLSIVESRLGRLEIDVARLNDVPSSLARIEEKITALSEKADGQGNIIETIGVGVTMSVLSGVIAFGLGKRSKQG